jgi:hypothetical protein
VLEPGGDSDLAQERVGALARGQLGPEDLDRDRAIVAEVVRAVDHGHAAAAELALDAVAVGERGGEAGGGIGQRADPGEVPLPYSADGCRAR